MKKEFIRIFSLIISIGITGYSCNSQGNSVVANGEEPEIRIYNYPVNPRQYPDDARRYVKPPDAATFGNQIQFIALRGLDDNYMKELDDNTIKYGLGNIIWPQYPILYRKDLPAIVDELKKRNLYLFDIGGFVPGSGPNGYWQQFVAPQGALDLIQKTLGDHWLGMDNGEQDGRYIGGFANQMIPPGAGREQQYLNFQNHFQGLTDRLGNKMSSLVGLTYGHYFLKEGIYYMLGAETAQGLPNTQIFYSFIRGAGKQYGVPWFGNASVWNRWGWKNYTGNSNNNGGANMGTSLSLLKRLMYSQIMYNCSALGFEGSFLDKDGGLSPIGKIQQAAAQWVKKNGSPGIQYTPAAVMLDFFSGWTFPRHLFTGNIYRAWGNLPYEDEDYFTDNLLNVFYPGYQDASYFHDETGFIAPAPYGDITDCILSDCPEWVMQQYPVLVIGNKLNGGNEIKDKLEKYVVSGGHLIITAGSLENLPGGLSGISVGNETSTISGNSPVTYNNSELKESADFTIRQLVYPAGTKVIANSNDKALAIEHDEGLGKITVFASPFGLASAPLNFSKSDFDAPLRTPYPMLKHVSAILNDIFSRLPIFNAGGPQLNLITCSKSKGEFTVAVVNNSWMEQQMNITSNVGKIVKITELSLDNTEQNDTGFLPNTIPNNTGKNGPATIAGGEIRIFNIKIDSRNISNTPPVQPIPNPVNKGLTLRNIPSIKDEILLRPTFFQHFDRVVIDWKYLLQKDNATIEKESGWISRQGLKVIIDFSSGINLFPDLRMVNNHRDEYDRSMDEIKSVIDKMAVLGASDIIIASHRMIENNFTTAQFNDSLLFAIKAISQYAGKNNINVNLRMAPARNPGNLDQVIALVKAANEPNLFAALDAALLLDNTDDFGKNLAILKTMKARLMLVSAPEKDSYGTLWNINKPIHYLADKNGLLQLFSSVPGSDLILDGIYKSKDEEYEDINIIENR